MRKSLVLTVFASFLLWGCYNNQEAMYSKEYQYPPYIRDMQVPTDENRETSH